ncbi:uncharacterized protein TNIN_320722 [Trichonephila inaurata madagascariensis]|uniref:Uncharacterized protein n=1 Tax=Trichonephila inaurata madagascariensis TaxID=2747483 RepID=A0A8X6Y524_9ARAC|nr:uncharacterized protein TNIN_320722 [Trichonephila inaurata madagascariensis]
MPHRQNSMSIDDPEEQTLPNWNAHGPSNYSFQNSIPSKNGCLSEDCCVKPPSLSKSSPRKVNAVNSFQNVPESTNQKKVELQNDFSPEQKHLSYAIEPQVKDSVLQPFVTNNKKEALLERKIRIFSKFFTNLGNLSKSIQDRHSDNKHKDNRDSQFCDVIGTDKQGKSNVRSDFCAIPARKCSTPPPEFDRLLNLLNNTNSPDIKFSETQNQDLKETKDFSNQFSLRPRIDVYNSEENGLDSRILRKENTTSLPDILQRDAVSSKSDESSRASTSQLSFKVVTRELEDLQQSIQKAKEMRIDKLDSFFNIRTKTRDTFQMEISLQRPFVFLPLGCDGRCSRDYPSGASFKRQLAAPSAGLSNDPSRLSSAYAGTRQNDCSPKSSEVTEHQFLRNKNHSSPKSFSESCEPNGSSPPTLLITRTKSVPIPVPLADKTAVFGEEKLATLSNLDDICVNRLGMADISSQFLHYKTSALCHQDVYKRLADMRKALKDLREKSQREVLEDTSFWQEEIKKVKEETNKAWQEKLDRMESRLASQEEELRRLQSDNENLHKMLDSQRLGSPTCHCKSENGQNGFGRIDSAFEDDEEYFSHKPSIPIQSTRQECDRLQERLSEEEQRADQLKLLLNQKLIEFNKLQLTLSKQTKEMIELEKSYLQVQCRLRRGTSKPVVARLCSRTSPFASKNLCPKPSPPATPKPNGVS